MQLQVKAPAGAGEFRLLDPAKDPGRFMGFEGRSAECQVSVGQPTIRREGQTLVAGFEKPIDPRHDPRGVLAMRKGAIAAGPDKVQPFNEDLTVELAYDAAGAIEFAWFFADGPADQDRKLALASADDFEGHLQAAEAHWAAFVADCRKRIEAKLHVELSRLSPTEAKVLDWNLIYLKQMQVGTGGWTASITNYWFCYMRDDGVTAEFADRLGLAEVYNRDYLRGVFKNHMTHPKWGVFWDTWYNNNYRDAEGEIESQSDSEYYAVRGAYNFWKSTGSREFLTPANLALLKGAVDYLETRYWDADKGMFKADRINESLRPPGRGPRPQRGQGGLGHRRSATAARGTPVGS